LADVEAEALDGPVTVLVIAYVPGVPDLVTWSRKPPDHRDGLDSG